RRRRSGLWIARLWRCGSGQGARVGLRRELRLTPLLHPPQSADQYQYDDDADDPPHGKLPIRAYSFRPSGRRRVRGLAPAGKSAVLAVAASASQQPRHSLAQCRALPEPFAVVALLPPVVAERVEHLVPSALEESGVAHTALQIEHVVCAQEVVQPANGG